MNGSLINFAEAHVDLGITVDRNLKFHGYIKNRVNIAGALTNNILSSTVCRERDFLLTLFTTHVRPQLEYGSVLWNQGYITDNRLLEKAQRRWTRSVAGLEGLPYEHRLRALNLFSIKGRLLRADLIYTWKVFSGMCAVQPFQLFSPALGQTTRGHSLKLQVERSRLDIRKRCFSRRIVSVWNSLSQDTVSATSLESFKRGLHGDLGDRLFDFD